MNLLRRQNHSILSLLPLLQNEILVLVAELAPPVLHLVAARKALVGVGLAVRLDGALALPGGLATANLHPVIRGFGGGSIRCGF